ncbi:MAG: carboxypeptidase regulatory-like domain-containing protein [Candidatus Zixiibacteriota bacterium]|nr:MAG: carboxypeptidase regulatory-like domain-containing protein [candidate division Zixibacteria bacterium]
MSAAKSKGTISALSISITFLILICSGSAGAFTLSGTVTDIDTIPVGLVAVQVYYNGNPVGNAFDTTDGSGIYSISGLPSATYDIGFTPHPTLNLRSRMILDFTILGDTILDVRLFPEDHYYVEGLVTDTLGNGLPEIDLNFYDQVADTLIPTTGDDTDSSGYYDVLVPAGVYRIVYRPIAGQPYVPVQLFNVGIVADTVIDVVLEGGYYVQGTVTGPNGPVVNADIDADDSFTGERIYTLNDNTNGLGEYRIVVPPGTFDISIIPQIGNRIVPDIAYGVVVDGNIILNFNLISGSILSGNVEKSGSSGVPGVDLDVFEYSTGLKIFTPNDNTNQSGFFQMVIPHGNFNIEIEPPDSLRLSSVFLENFAFYSDTVITVVVDTGMYVSGTVTDSTGSGVPYVSINAYVSPGGVPVFAPGNKTDMAGLYDVIISPDTYDIIYRPDSLPGILDSVILNDLPILSDTVIDVMLPSAGPDTVPPSVTVISPNGGENWASYSVQTILWNATDNLGVTSIDIFFSSNGTGGPYNLVSSGESDDGLYLWNIPDDTTDNAFIKIIAYDYASNSAEDLSDGPFTIFSSSSDCDYVAGDINNSGGTNGLDVIYMVNYFKGGSSPPYICQCTAGNSWYVAGDVNNSCSFNGLDVTYLVGYFKGGPILLPCQDCPPPGLILKSKDQ